MVCVALLQRYSVIGLTGTLMWNRILDLYGYFNLLGGHLEADKEEGAPLTPTPDLSYQEYLCREEEWDFPRPLQGMVGNADPPRGLRQGATYLGDRIVGLDGEEIIIGAEIPPIKVMTVKVRYGLLDQLEHNARYFRLIQALSSSGEEDDGANNDLDKTAGRQNIGVMRQLALLGSTHFWITSYKGSTARILSGTFYDFHSFIQFSLPTSHFPPSIQPQVQKRQNPLDFGNVFARWHALPEGYEPSNPLTPEDSRATMSNKSSLGAINREMPSSPATRRRSNLLERTKLSHGNLAQIDQWLMPYNV
ncbi:Helicase C-terminal [Penicillium subrubescens]|uniref:Helicase C-terminal n=1 Tax=Penicillium subrubescens TaxID=1316194 RepID=UPI002545BB2A|nr:Helicase C-terminal [Penicillium subrubescens]KAJ5883559.1 Helicase C-terminal [Penicillium subrubescens]